MIRLRKVLSQVFVLVVICPLMARGTPTSITLHGRVINKRDRSPLPSVTVSIVGNEGNSTATNSDGRFSLKMSPSVQPGQEVNIHAEKTGFISYTGAVIAATVLDRDIELVPEPRARAANTTRLYPPMPESILYLAKQLDVSDTQTRKNAALELGKLGGTARVASPFLIAAVTDKKEDFSVKIAALDALGLTGVSSDSEIAKISSAFETGETSAIRAAAARCLGRIHASKASYISEFKIALGHDTPDVQISSAEALLLLGSSPGPAVEVLCRHYALNDPNYSQTQDALLSVGSRAEGAMSCITNHIRPAANWAEVESALELLPPFEPQAKMLIKPKLDEFDLYSLLTLAVRWSRIDPSSRDVLAAALADKLDKAPNIRVTHEYADEYLRAARLGLELDPGVRNRVGAAIIAISFNNVVGDEHDDSYENDVRVQLRDFVAELGVDTLAPLIERLTPTDPWEVDEVSLMFWSASEKANSLSNDDKARLFPIIIKNLKLVAESEIPEIRYRSALALARLHAFTKSGSGLIIECLKIHNEYLLATILDSIDRYGPLDSSLASSVAWVLDEHTYVQNKDKILAARILRKIGPLVDSDLLETLLRVRLDDATEQEQLDFRHEIATVLAHTGTPIVHELAKRLDELSNRNEQLSTEEEALARMGPSASGALQALTSILGIPTLAPPWDPSYRYYRPYAISHFGQILACIGPDAKVAVPILIRELAPPPGPTYKPKRHQVLPPPPPPPPSPPGSKPPPDRETELIEALGDMGLVAADALPTLAKLTANERLLKAAQTSINKIKHSQENPYENLCIVRPLASDIAQVDR